MSKINKPLVRLCVRGEGAGINFFHLSAWVRVKSGDTGRVVKNANHMKM